MHKAVQALTCVTSNVRLEPPEHSLGSNLKHAPSQAARTLSVIFRYAVHLTKVVGELPALHTWSPTPVSVFVASETYLHGMA